MKVQPIGDKVVIKRIEPAQTTASGIFIPTTAQQKNTYARVMAVGNGTVNENGILIPLTVKIGDVVLVSTLVGTEIKINNDQNHVIKEQDIIAIIDDFQE